MLAIITAILAILGILALAAGFAVFGGTLLWLLWPTAMDAFPRLVGEGWVEPNLSWWSSVCLVWVFTILVKASQTNTSK